MADMKRSDLTGRMVMVAVWQGWAKSEHRSRPVQRIGISYRVVRDSVYDGLALGAESA